MSKDTNSERQRRYRDRIKQAADLLPGTIEKLADAEDRAERAVASLRAILLKLVDNEKSLAVELRAIAEKGLK